MEVLFTVSSNIGACFGNACTIAERSRNLFACESVFLCLNMRGNFPNDSLLIV